MKNSNIIHLRCHNFWRKQIHLFTKLTFLSLLYMYIWSKLTSFIIQYCFTLWASGSTNQSSQSLFRKDETIKINLINSVLRKKVSYISKEFPCITLSSVLWFFFLNRNIGLSVSILFQTLQCLYLPVNIKSIDTFLQRFHFIDSDISFLYKLYRFRHIISLQIVSCNKEMKISLKLQNYCLS